MSLRDVLEAIRSRPLPANEETAKFQIIRPVLDHLGWDTADPEVLWEHSVGDRKSGGKVDIALRGGRRIAALIEAKAPGQELNKHVAQVLGYAFYEGINICVLTNGPEWRIYLPKEDGPPEERCFANLDLMNGPIERLAEDLEAFLGKENLLGKRSERRAKEVLKARRQADHLNSKLPEIWSQMVREPDQRLVELVVDRAYEELNLRPAPEQVQAVLRGSPVPTVTPPKPGAPPGDYRDDLPGAGTRGGTSDLEHRILDRYGAWNSGQDRGRENSSRLNSLLYSWFELAEEDRQMTVSQMAAIVGKTPDTLRERARRSDEVRREAGEVTHLRRRVVAYELWGQRHEAKTWAAMLVGVAEALYQRHGASFDRILSFRGRTQMYASRHRDDISYNPKVVGTSGIFIETHGDVATKKRRAGQLLKLFGHSADDLTIETQTN